MNNVIYFTTALETDDFKEYLKIWKKPINSSNQIFHNKLIRSISLTNHVDVISIRPFSKTNCLVKKLDKGEKITSQIHWHYLKIRNNHFVRLFSSWFQAVKLVFKLPKNSIVITDTINPFVLNLATFIAKQRNLKTELNLVKRRIEN